VSTKSDPPQTDFAQRVILRLRRSRKVQAAVRRARRGWRSLTAPPSTPLARAARRGDAAAVARLVDAGADLRTDGAAALREAAAWDRVEAAALLLARGADASGLDPREVSPETLHAIRQIHHRRRDPHPAPGASDAARALAAELDARGVAVVPGLAGPELLARLRAEFAAFIASLEAKLAEGRGLLAHYDEEEHFWAHDRAYICNNAFRYSPALVELTCHPLLMQAAELYIGRRPHIQRGGAMRYLPLPTVDNDMFGWHHDMEDKRFKIQVLLTDVPDGGRGQNMSYVLGSHRPFHPYAMFTGNACTLDYCREQVGSAEVFECTGKAGDVFIFDSNGAHRGNRRDTAPVRDVFMVEYTADESYIWGGDIDPAVLARQPAEGRAALELMTRATPAWDKPIVRTLPMWAELLPNVASWV
jgi:hypothetical protein